MKAMTARGNPNTVPMLFGAKSVTLPAKSACMGIIAGMLGQAAIPMPATASATGR